MKYPKELFTRFTKEKVLILCTALVPVVAALCISLPATAAACSPLPTSEGTATATFTVKTAGTYRVWAHVYAPAAGSGAVDLAIDSNCPISVGNSALPTGTFNWLDTAAGTATPATVALTGGTHTVTVAGESANIGVDEVLLTTNTSCRPDGSGSNCAPGATVAATPASPSGHAKAKPSLLKLIAAAAPVAVIAALLTSAVMYYAARHKNLFGRMPIFKNRDQTAPEAPGAPQVFVMSGIQESGPRLSGKGTILVVSIVVGIICGLATSIALAAADYNIIITFSSAKTSGQAKVVSDAQALSGSMLQFGSGSTAAAPTGPAVASTSSSTSSQKSKASTSPSGSNAGSGSNSGSNAGSGSSPGSDGGGSGTSCTDPGYSSGDAEATDNTDPDDGDQYWWVNNDAWSGSAGPQTIYVCNQSSWYVVSNQTDNGGQVETYPDTEYDVGGRANGTTKTISQWNTITGSFAEDFPADGSWDAGYDLWTNDWSNETMIWNQWEGSQDYWYQQATITATLDGVPYKFIDNGGELIFMRESQVQSGSVDILAAWKWEVANGYASASDVPTQLEYGVEICATNGPETFPVNNVSFTLE